MGWDPTMGVSLLFVFCLTESPAPSRGLFDHDTGADDVPELGEEPVQGLVGHCVGDVEHKQVASVRPCLAQRSRDTQNEQMRWRKGQQAVREGGRWKR